MKPIYLDYMATTPVDPKVVTEMLRYLGPESIFANPASLTHDFGQQALLAIDTARIDIAEVIKASPEEIIFTSGATEANNLAILGSARFYQTKGRHLITMATEHKSVLASFEQLEQEGFEVTYLRPNNQGLLEKEKLENALRTDTILVSVMQVNNETGVIQDIEAVGNLLKNKGIVFHVDAAQSAGKLTIDVKQQSIDLLSISAHKIYGPKGIGALYVRQRPRLRLKPLTFGGLQERGLRAGTLATHQITGFAKALTLAHQNQTQEQKRLLKLRQRLWQGIKTLPGVKLHGSLTRRVAGNLNFYLPGLTSNNLPALTAKLAISTTSACLAASLQPSYVLTAMGVSKEQAYQSLRLSIGRFTSQEDVINAIIIINNFYKAKLV